VKIPRPAGRGIFRFAVQFPGIFVFGDAMPDYLYSLLSSINAKWRIETKTGEEMSARM
jgi:hypothetical protein